MARVLVLLDTHDDAYDGEMSRPERSTTGFSDPRKRTMLCGGCGGAGCQSCERHRAVLAADGVELKPGRVLVTERDPYDNGEKGFWAGPRQKTMTAKQAEEALRRLEEDRDRRAGVYGDPLDFESSVRRADQRDTTGSYREVRTAMSFAPKGLHPRALAEWIALAIPGPIRVPRWAYERELDELSEHVAALGKQGYNVQETAMILGIPRRQVKRLIKQRSAR